jgi:hypothetical protein
MSHKWDDNIIFENKEKSDFEKYLRIYGENEYKYFYDVVSKLDSNETPIQYSSIRDYAIYESKLCRELFTIVSIIESKFRGIIKTKKLDRQFVECCPNSRKKGRKNKTKGSFEKRVDDASFRHVCTVICKEYGLNQQCIEEVINLRNRIAHNRLHLDERSHVDISKLLSLLSDQDFIDEKITKINYLFNNKVNKDDTLARKYRLKIDYKITSIVGDIN